MVLPMRKSIWFSPLNADLPCEKRNYLERDLYIMPSLSALIAGFFDYLTGHLALTAYLLAVTDERNIWRRLKKLPLLLLSPLIITLLSVGRY